MILTPEKHAGFFARGVRALEQPKAPPVPLGDGPGTELLALFEERKTTRPSGCDCEDYARQMNAWGVTGCRERLNEIVGHLKDSMSLWTWAERVWNEVKAGVIGILSSGPLTLEGIVEEAIRRAEVKQVEAQKKTISQGSVAAGNFLPPERPIRRNLLYHLYPVAGNGVWQWNVDQIMRRIDQFDGRRIVAIVTDHSTSLVDEVKAAFAGKVSEWIVLVNNPSLREVATFPSLFSALQVFSHRDVTFYAHNKGTRHGLAENRGTTATLWAEIMYEACLDYPDEIDRLMKHFPVVGPFKKIGAGFQGSRSAWHYSGSFFWFNNRSLYSRNWREIDYVWFGIEPYLSLHFSEAEAGFMVRQGIVGVINDTNRQHGMAANHLDMYDWRYVNEIVKPEWEQWKRTRG